MNDISLDCLFAVNFAIDYVALKLCAMILKKEKKSKSLAASAILIAASESLSCVAPKILPWWSVTVFSVIVVFFSCFDAVFTALYTGLSLWSGLALTFVMKYFKGVLSVNGAQSLPIQTDKKRLVFAALTGAALLILKLFLDKAQRKCEKATLEVAFKDKRVRLSALRDSGNLLRDPLSGRPVAVLSLSGAKKLGVSEKAVMDHRAGFRVIPVKSVGHTGILYAFVPKLSEIDGKKRKICVAIDKNSVDFSGYDAIIPSNL